MTTQKWDYNNVVKSINNKFYINNWRRSNIIYTRLDILGDNSYY